jgi:hypothetical protein
MRMPPHKPHNMWVSRASADPHPSMQDHVSPSQTNDCPHRSHWHPFCRGILHFQMIHHRLYQLLMVIGRRGHDTPVLSMRRAWQETMYSSRWPRVHSWFILILIVMCMFVLYLYNMCYNGGSNEASDIFFCYESTFDRYPKICYIIVFYYQDRSKLTIHHPNLATQKQLAIFSNH